MTSNDLERLRIIFNYTKHATSLRQHTFIVLAFDCLVGPRFNHVSSNLTSGQLSLLPSAGREISSSYGNGVKA